MLGLCIALLVVLLFILAGLFAWLWLGRRRKQKSYYSRVTIRGGMSVMRRTQEEVSLLYFDDMNANTINVNAVRRGNK